MPRIFNLQRVVLAIATFAVIALGSATASADTVTFNTAPGATESSGLAVSAQVIFDVNPATNLLTITLTNLVVNPTSVAQNISDLFFHVGTLSGTLDSSSANFINVAANGTINTTGLTNPASTGWGLDSSTGGNFHLNDLGFAGPEHTIIGAPNASGVYSNANTSIAGNDPHNPFINQTATFTLTIAGLTSATQIDGVVFSFGTEPGNNVPGVPEPATMLLLGTGLLGLAGAARWRLSSR